MVVKKEIAYLDNNKINNEHLKLLGLNPTDSVQRFYVNTPLSSDFYNKLIIKKSHKLYIILSFIKIFMKN